MERNDRNTEFEEADREYAELARKRDAGDITNEEFDAERKRLMVLDKRGRWWAKSAATGEWRHYDGKEWVPGTPPGYHPPATPGKDGSEKDGSEKDEPEGETNAAGRTPPDTTAREVVDGHEERRSGGALRRPVAVAAALLVVLLVGGGYLFTRGATLTSGTSGGDGTAEIPDLIGASSVEEARDAAGGDFEVIEGDGVESEEAIGAVVAQEPAPGERAAVDSTIYVDVSEGVIVPDVEGNSRDAAARTLEDAGFDVEESTGESSAADEGDVTEQNPPGGEYAEAGSLVAISVGEGPPPDAGTGGGDGDGGGVVPDSDSTTVPDVVGENVEDAEDILGGAGFATEAETVESERAANTVVWSDPAPGTPADAPSTEVILGVSSGPPESPSDSPPDDQYVPLEHSN